MRYSHWMDNFNGRPGRKARLTLFAHDGAACRTRPWIYCDGLYPRDTHPAEKWIQCAKCVNSCHAGECAAENNDRGHSSRVLPARSICLLFIIRFKTRRSALHISPQEISTAVPYILESRALFPVVQVEKWIDRDRDSKRGDTIKQQRD